MNESFDKTISGGKFDEVFTEVHHAESLGLKNPEQLRLFTSMSITMHSPLMGWKFSFGRISGSMYFRAPRLRTIVLKTMCTASGWMPSTS